MKNHASSLTPVKFRALLIVIMVALLAIGVGGFYLAQKSLAKYADNIRTTVAEAEASENSITQLKDLETELNKYKAAGQRADGITIDQQSYQNQVISDLNKYATQAGITISQFNFQAAGTASTPTPNAAVQAESGSQLAPAAKNSASFSISLTPPVNYTSLLRFVKSIEQSLPKMQVSGLSLSPGSENNVVTIDTLTIEVFLK